MIVLYMSMSLDGFVVGPDDSMEEPMGRGGFRLFNWLDDRDSDGPSGQVYRESLATGAVIAGRRTFEHAGRWKRRPPRRRADLHPHPPRRRGRRTAGQRPLRHRCRRVRRPGKAAAGDRNVMVHGAGAAQALLRAGLLDELELHVVNVLLGQGRRLFDNLPAEYIELEPVRQLVDRDVTHLHYRVVH